MEQRLADRGASVDAVALYRRLCDDELLWPDTPLLAVLVTSVESWHCLRRRLPPGGADCRIIVGSERIAEAVRADGMTRVVAAASPRDEDMLECLKNHRNH